MKTTETLVLGHPVAIAGDVEEVNHTFFRLESEAEDLGIYTTCMRAAFLGSVQEANPNLPMCTFCQNGDIKEDNLSPWLERELGLHS